MDGAARYHRPDGAPRLPRVQSLRRLSQSSISSAVRGLSGGGVGGGAGFGCGSGDEAAASSAASSRAVSASSSKDAEDTLDGPGFAVRL